LRTILSFTFWSSEKQRKQRRQFAQCTKLRFCDSASHGRRLYCRIRRSAFEV
ncbi:hypothetical protein T06_15790, partial [Trichinella sp. T6]